MDKELVEAYFREYGQRYQQADIFKHYPETRTFPAYIKRHFGQAKIVLDLGFGSGLWFWASFLPALERLDGLDLYWEALEEANRIFDFEQVPAGYRAAHAQAGYPFTLLDLKQLKQKGGYFGFQDYRSPWPEVIAKTQYDLVTETGGGLGQMNSDAEVVAVISKVSQVLKPGGCLLFMNFDVEPSELDQKLGRVAAPSWGLRPELLEEAVGRARMELVDFHVLNQGFETANVERTFYGYAQKTG